MTSVDALGQQVEVLLGEGINPAEFTSRIVKPG